MSWDMELAMWMISTLAHRETRHYSKTSGKGNNISQMLRSLTNLCCKLVITGTPFNH